jgi:hypothetical protein
MITPPMIATPGPRGPTGADLLSGTPEAIEHCRTMARVAFPDGIPSMREAAVVADAIWRHLREHPEGAVVAWDPQDAAAQLISAAFQRGGLAAAFAQARRGAAPAAPARLRVTAYREEEV